MLLTGGADLAIQQKPELYLAGTEIVGPLPANLNLLTVFVAGIGADSTSADAAKMMIDFLHSPEAAVVFKAKGLDPI